MGGERKEKEGEGEREGRRGMAGLIPNPLLYGSDLLYIIMLVTILRY